MRLNIAEPLAQLQRRFQSAILAADGSVPGFIAADATPLAAVALSTLPAERWPELRLSFHPSLRPLVLYHSVTRRMSCCLEQVLQGSRLVAAGSKDVHGRIQGLLGVEFEWSSNVHGRYNGTERSISQA